jgi:hypothetical protein
LLSMALIKAKCRSSGVITMLEQLQ